MNEKIKILVVDDEENLRCLYEKQLESEGYDVVTVTNGEEAVKKFKYQPVDLVVFDLSLPEDSGLEYLLKIQEVNRNTKLIVNADYTPYAMDFSFWAADACLAKSSDLTELKITIDTLLHPIQY